MLRVFGSSSLSQDSLRNIVFPWMIMIKIQKLARLFLAISPWWSPVTSIPHQAAQWFILCTINHMIRCKSTFIWILPELITKTKVYMNTKKLKISSKVWGRSFTIFLVKFRAPIVFIMVIIRNHLMNPKTREIRANLHKAVMLGAIKSKRVIPNVATAVMVRNNFWITFSILRAQWLSNSFLRCQRMNK